jgi:beta-glucosidase
MLELRGFHKIALAPGERGKVRFHITAAELRFVGADLSPRLEPGAIDLHVGQSSAKHTLLSARIELKADA